MYSTMYIVEGRSIRRNLGFRLKKYKFPILVTQELPTTNNDLFTKIAIQSYMFVYQLLLTYFTMLVITTSFLTNMDHL